MTPSNDLVEPNDPGNNATYWDPNIPDFTIGSPYYRTIIGAHENSGSPYHTFDQGGNVMEWNATVILNPYGGDPERGLRGGAFLNTPSNLAATDRSYYFPPTTDGMNIGFRVASVPKLDWIGGDGSDPTDWSLAANWDPGSGVPDGPGTKVVFGNQLPDHDVVDMISVGRTVGNIAFTAATSTTIQSTGGYNLTLDNNGNDSIVTVEGNHLITAEVILEGNLDLSGSGTLTLSGGIRGSHGMDILNGTVIAKSVQLNGLYIGAGAKLIISAVSGSGLESEFTPIPEPSTVILLGVGVLGLFAYASPKRACLFGGVG